MIIYCYEDPEMLAEAAARMFVEAAMDAILDHDSFNVALSGGSTPPVLHRHLADSEYFTPEIIAKSRFFFGDERSVPPDHEESNVKLARDTLFRPCDIPRELVHVPNGGSDNLELEALRYEITIKRHVPLSPGTGIPSLDLVILGMGPDGHTASLFPGTAALHVPPYRVFVSNEVPQLNTHRLTMTYSAINAASHILIMVTGEKKAPVMREIFDPQRRENVTNPYPIEGVRGNGSNVIWLADHAAISQFSQEQLDYFSIDIPVKQEEVSE
ncbi:MAG: 6-phosphogluconolactonase [Sumerlaeia bacterium]